jgi:hypothetical protein
MNLLPGMQLDSMTTQVTLLISYLQFIPWAENYKDAFSVSGTCKNMTLSALLCADKTPQKQLLAWHKNCIFTKVYYLVPH